ncbi:MAG: response regulator [Pseudomonadota bacterium]|nr:response regulator [Pseudomonadota bacterium]
MSFTMQGPPAVPTARRDVGRNLNSTRSLRVLIVEDDSLIALFLELLLQELGHDVVGVARSGSTAIEAAGEHRPDLVLMDVRLAGHRDGAEVAAEIRWRFGIPAIFMTAQSDLHGLRHARAARPIDHLVKPVSEQAFKNAMQRAAGMLGAGSS